MYVSFLGICPPGARTPHPPGGSPVSGALDLDIFQQPAQQVFLSNLLGLMAARPCVEEGFDTLRLVYDKRFAKQYGFFELI